MKAKSDELVSTQNVLKETTETLDQTTETLKQTEYKLAKTTKQRDEQIHLVTNHVQSEKQLQEQAKQVRITDKLSVCRYIIIMTPVWLASTDD